MVLKQICHEAEGWRGRNGQHVTPHVYKYSQLYSSASISESENCFWGYFQEVAKKHFEVYWRQMDDVEKEELEIIDRETRQPKTVKALVRQTLSMDQSFSSEPSEEKRGNAIFNEASERVEEEQDYTQADKLRAKAVISLAGSLAPSFQAFFDQVNALDEGASNPNRLDERKILSFHVSYALNHFPTRLLIPPPGKNASGYDYILDEREEYLKARPKFLHLLKSKYDEPLDAMIAYQNHDYGVIFFSQFDFLMRLKKRVSDLQIGGQPFLFHATDAGNKAYGWVDTVWLRDRTLISATNAYRSVKSLSTTADTRLLDLMKYFSKHQMAEFILLTKLIVVCIRRGP